MFSKFSALILTLAFVGQPLSLAKKANALERNQIRLQRHAERIARRFDRLGIATQKKWIARYLNATEANLAQIQQMGTNDWARLQSKLKLPTPTPTSEDSEDLELENIPAVALENEETTRAFMIHHLEKCRDELLHFQNQREDRSVASVPVVEYKTLTLAYIFFFLGILVSLIGGTIFILPVVLAIGIGLCYFGCLLGLIGLTMDLIHSLRGESSFIRW